MDNAPDSGAVVAESPTAPDFAAFEREGFAVSRVGHAVFMARAEWDRAVEATGHAVDLGACVGAQVRWDWPLYERLNAAMQKAAAECGVPIEWGGSWRTLKDGPHFQLPWKNYP